MKGLAPAFLVLGWPNDQNIDILVPEEDVPRDIEKRGLTRHRPELLRTSNREDEFGGIRETPSVQDLPAGCSLLFGGGAAGMINRDREQNTVAATPVPSQQLPASAHIKNGIANRGAQPEDMIGVIVEENRPHKLFGPKRDNRDRVLHMSVKDHVAML